MADEATEIAETTTEETAEADETTETTTAEPTADSADWRGTLKTDDAKTFAESSPDVDHLVNRALALQKRVSAAVVLPGEGATEEEVTAYRKQIGVPETVEGYKFPDLAEGQEMTDEIQGQRTVWAERFHGLNIPAEAASALIEAYGADLEAAAKSVGDADKRYADESEAELRKSWPGDEFDKNSQAANVAGQHWFGNDFEDARRIETKDGRFLMDHPVVLRAFASVGRAMGEGGLVPALSEADLVGVDEQLRDVRTKISDAQGRGDNREANRLYQQEQALIAKSRGNQSIVGSQGRAA